MKKMSGWEGLEASCPNISGAQGAFYWLYEVHAFSPTASALSPLKPFRSRASGLRTADFQAD